MKTVNIYVCGTYEYKSRIGTWAYYLEYNGAVKKQSAQAGGLKSNAQTTLIALMKALADIKYPCNLVIHSKYPLGFKNPKTSSNKELIAKIIKHINTVGHIVEFKDKCDFKQCDEWERLYGNNKKKETKKVDPNEVFAMTSNDEEKHLERMAEEARQDWRTMYSDLMGPSQGCWVPGSGGY